MISLLFCTIILGFAWFMWRACVQTRVRPDSVPGAIVRLVGDKASEHVVMNATALICTCNDWQRRRYRFDAGTPMRLCKHLALYHARHLDSPSPQLAPYAPIITTRALEGMGLPCGPGTEYGQLDDRPYVLYAQKNRLPEVRLLAGSQSLIYNLETRLWDGPAPPKEAYFAMRSRQLAEML